MYSRVARRLASNAANSTALLYRSSGTAVLLLISPLLSLSSRTHPVIRPIGNRPVESEHALATVRAGSRQRAAGGFTIRRRFPTCTTSSLPSEFPERFKPPSDQGLPLDADPVQNRKRR